MKRRPCYFCLSFLSVAIVVMASCVAQSLIDRAPIIFLTTAEGPGGQIDIELTPNYELVYGIRSSYLFPYLNLTRVNEVLPNKYKTLSTARNDFSVIGYISCQIEEEDLDQIKSKCYSTKSGTIHAIDTNQEDRIGIGREYTFKPLKQGEALIHQKYADILNIKKGDDLVAKFDVSNYISSVLQQLCFQQDKGYCNNQYLNSLQQLPLKIKIVDVIDDTYGKLSNDGSKTFLFMERDQIHQFLISFLKNPEDEDIKEFAKDFQKISSDQFADSVLINLEDRINVYLNSNYDEIQFEVSQFASQISEKLGVYPILMELPVLSRLYDVRFGSMFLGIILNMIVFILFMLSLMLLYNLLLVSIETKNFELAVLRTLGLNKTGVISLILVQSMSYVLPALVCGICISMLALSVISGGLESSIGVKLSAMPTSNAIIMALIVGILIPIFASIVPIRQALGQVLSIALDINRSKSQAVKINIDIEGKSFPWGRIGFALIATLFGVSIYYFLPLALLSFNLGLLINIFFWILIGMLVGFILMMLNIQYLLEKMVVYITLFWTGSAIRSLVIKNLASHRLKNRRVAVMYSLSIAFIIFVWTFSIIQIKSSEFQEKQIQGTYLTVEIEEGFSFSKEYLPAKDMEELIHEQLKDEIDSYSWQTINLGDFVGAREGFREIYLTHVGKIYREDILVYGLSSNFLKTTFSDQFLKVGEEAQEDIDLDIIEQLYTARGSQSMVITERTRKYLRAGLEDNDSLYLVMNNGTYSRQHELRVSSVIEGAPVLRTNGFDLQSVAVSMPTFMRLCGTSLQGYQDIPMKTLLIKTKNQSKEVVDKVFNTMQQFINENGVLATIWDYRDYESNIQDQQSVISFIFSVITVIVMVLCFFSLISSMTANIMEQSKEIAVLRAIGLTKNQMIRLYVYEAYTLVLSSSLIGMIVGIIVGFTMGLQRALFTELPIAFEFPTSIFISVFIASIICAVLSTYVPSKRIMNNQISQIIRITG